MCAHGAWTADPPEPFEESPRPSRQAACSPLQADIPAFPVEVLMKLALIGSVGLLVIGSLAFAEDARSSGSVERPFVEGGRVRLDLSSADYTVRAGSADRVRVSWTADDEAKVKDLKKLSVNLQVSGNVATIVTDGPAKHVRFVVEVPARSDVHLRVRAGDVELQGIEGNKDIRMTAGDLKIGVRPESLATAHASVTFGDLDARALGIAKSGVKRSLDWIGGGTYALDARLGAGDIKINEIP
jgi:hypothetical protein